jgi:hypothetical protein
MVHLATAGQVSNLGLENTNDNGGSLESKENQRYLYIVPPRPDFFLYMYTTRKGGCPGNDIRPTLRMSDAASCSRSCYLHPQCVAFTLNNQNRNCNLKTKSCDVTRRSKNKKKVTYDYDEDY